MYAQSWQMPLERGITLAIESHLSEADSIVQTAVKPFHRNDFARDSIRRFRVDDRRYFNVFEVKMFRDHLIEVEEEDFTLYVDAILDLDIGRDFGDTSSYQDSVRIFNNTRGGALYGRIGDHVSFHATAFENQSYFPNWLFRYTDSLRVVPGQGRFKELEQGGRDYNSATGVISIDASDWLQVHFGHGKHFIGHGYRSMLLSDVAFNYPYVRLELETRNKKLKYVNVNAELNSLNRLPIGEVPESLFAKKGFTFRYLSWMPHSRLELGAYEGMIWQRWDSTGTQPYPLSFYTPLPFLGTALYGLDSTQNSVVGLNMKLKLHDRAFLYGQYVLDQQREGFDGFQAGLFIHDVKGLSLRIERNEGGRGLFAHRLPLQNYNHMNQSLAHPLGTDFRETVVILRHEMKRFWSEWRLIHQRQDAGIGGDQLSAQSDILSAPVSSSQSWISSVRFGYLINPSSNMNAILGWLYRDQETSSGHLVSSWFYLGFRVALFNRYYDV